MTSDAPPSTLVQISDQQLREAIAAAGEVLSGAPTSRVLELSDKISLAKMVLGAVLRGELVIGRPQPAPPPANREQRRAARHKPA